MFAAYLISGVPSFLSGPLELLYDGAGDAGFLAGLLTAKRMSGVPSRFSGVAPLPGKALFTDSGVLFTVYLMSGVPSFLRGTPFRLLSPCGVLVLF